MEGSKLPEKQELCLSCRKCCMEVGIYTHAGFYTCGEGPIIDFYEKRGFTVTRSDELLVLTIKVPCPHLKAEGCDIYENRPKVCMDYSGVDDFGKGCFWSSLPEHRKNAGSDEQ